MAKTHILIVSDDDLVFIRRKKKANIKSLWMVPKSATPGDEAIVFHRGTGFVATAEILTVPQQSKFGNKVCYQAEVSVKNISPIAFDIIINKIPNWKWTNYPKGYTSIDGVIEKSVWHLVRKK